MKYFVLQVRTRQEDKMIQLIQKYLENSGLHTDECGRFFSPKREIQERRKGKKPVTVQRPIYSGYVFWETEDFVNDVYWMLRPIDGVYKFLKSNRNIEPLSGEGLKILKTFIQHSDVAKISKVFFDKNKRIRVVSGALKGLEGHIVKVDKRKKRAKVRLSFYKNSVPVDFGFDVLEQAENESK